MGCISINSWIVSGENAKIITNFTVKTYKLMWQWNDNSKKEKRRRKSIELLFIIGDTSIYKNYIIKLLIY